MNKTKITIKIRIKTTKLSTTTDRKKCVRESERESWIKRTGQQERIFLCLFAACVCTGVAIPCCCLFIILSSHNKFCVCDVISLTSSTGIFKRRTCTTQIASHNINHNTIYKCQCLFLSFSLRKITMGHTSNKKIERKKTQNKTEHRNTNIIWKKRTDWDNVECNIKQHTQNKIWSAKQNEIQNR